MSFISISILKFSSSIGSRGTGLPVITLNVRDPPPSGVTYSMVAVLDARSQKLFSMDSQTGLITTSARLDRESMDVHYLRVTASESLPDASGRQKSATATVQINVEDVNDFPPTFEQSGAYETAVKESASIGMYTLLLSHLAPSFFLTFIFLRVIVTKVLTQHLERKGEENGQTDKAFFLSKNDGAPSILPSLSFDRHQMAIYYRQFSTLFFFFSYL